MLENLYEPHNRYYLASMRLMELHQQDEVPDIVIESWEIYELNLPKKRLRDENGCYITPYVTLKDIFTDEDEIM